MPGGFHNEAAVDNDSISDVADYTHSHLYVRFFKCTRFFCLCLNLFVFQFEFMACFMLLDENVEGGYKLTFLAFKDWF